MNKREAQRGVNKEYNITGKLDKKNTRLLERIMQLKKLGLAFCDISFLVKRSEKRVKEIYYKEKKKLSTGKA